MTPSDDEAAKKPPVRVVIIDDTLDVRMLLKLHLSLEDGIEVVDEGDDGAVAVALAAAHQPDVMILDQMMPKMTGIEALPLVREASPGCKVIVYSSRMADETERAALKAGADAYVEKIKGPDHIVDVIRSITE